MSLKHAVCRDCGGDILILILETGQTKILTADGETYHSRVCRKLFYNRGKDFNPRKTF